MVNSPKPLNLVVRIVSVTIWPLPKYSPSYKTFHNWTVHSEQVWSRTIIAFNMANCTLKVKIFLPRTHNWVVLSPYQNRWFTKKYSRYPAKCLASCKLAEFGILVIDASGSAKFNTRALIKLDEWVGFSLEFRIQDIQTKRNKAIIVILLRFSLVFTGWKYVKRCWFLKLHQSLVLFYINWLCHVDLSINIPTCPTQWMNRSHCESKWNSLYSVA